MTQTQAKSKIDAVLKHIEQLGRIELDDMTLTMPLDSEVLPLLTKSVTDLETRLHISLPDDLRELWQKCSGLRLFEDKTYGQSGLIIWSPQKVLERRRTLEQKSHEFQDGDLVIGEFLGDSDLLVVKCDPDSDDFGQLIIALPIDHRSDWYCLPYLLPDFLQKFIHSQGEKFWEL
ncbi:MAG: SMI1/KNR4 family protein [Pseudanabaenaceae cyanobacterium]